MFDQTAKTPMHIETTNANNESIAVRLGEWDAIIGKLKARVEKADPESRIEYIKLIVALRNKRELLRQRLCSLSEN